MKRFNYEIGKYTQSLTMLPNTAGFSFYGVTHQDEVIRCYVSITPQGSHFIANLAGVPVYPLLKEWYKE